MPQLYKFDIGGECSHPYHSIIDSVPPTEGLLVELWFIATPPQFWNEKDEPTDIPTSDWISEILIGPLDCNAITKI